MYNYIKVILHYSLLTILSIKIIQFLIRLFIKVCGGIIDDASIKGNITLPIENVTAFVCQWDFMSINGTIVIGANFKIKESNISCSDDYILMASNGKFQLPRNTVNFHITSNLSIYL